MDMKRDLTWAPSVNSVADRFISRFEYRKRALLIPGMDIRKATQASHALLGLPRYAEYRIARLICLALDRVFDHASGQTAATLTSTQIDDLIRIGVATGGMQAKLEAAKKALADGVGQVLIAPGARAGIVAQLANKEATGTRITDGIR